MLAVLVTLGVLQSQLVHAQSQPQAPAPLTGIEMPRGELGGQDKFDPEAAKDAERARQLLRSLLAEDLARAAGKDGQKPSADKQVGAAGTGPAALSPTGPAAASSAQSALARPAGDAAPAMGQQLTGAGGADPVSRPSSASADNERKVTDRGAAAEDDDDAAAGRHAANTRVDSERTRALILSLVREVSPYVLGLLLLYLGFLALRAWLKRHARKADRSARSARSGRKRRHRRYAETAAAPAIDGSVAGDASAARN